MALHSSELGLSAIASLDQSEPETMGPLACLHMSHGRTLAKLGRLAESLLAHNSALATLRLLGHRELDIVRTLSELSGNFRALGRYDDALRYAQEAEALALAAPGGETLTFLPQLTSISSALGGLFLHLDRPKEAIACYRLCKTRSIRFYGGRSLQTAEATTDLGIALCGIRDLAGAEVQLRAAESIYRQRGWSDKTADELHLGMGQLMMRQGRYVVALDRYERSLAIMRTNLAPDNPRIAVVLDCIGAIHRRMDRPDAASLHPQPQRLFSGGPRRFVPAPTVNDRQGRMARPWSSALAACARTTAAWRARPRTGKGREGTGRSASRWQRSCGRWRGQRGRRPQSCGGSTRSSSSSFSRSGRSREW